MRLTRLFILSSPPFAYDQGIEYSIRDLHIPVIQIARNQKQQAQKSSIHGLQQLHHRNIRLVQSVTIVMTEAHTDCTLSCAFFRDDMFATFTIWVVSITNSPSGGVSRLMHIKRDQRCVQAFEEWDICAI